MSAAPRLSAQGLPPTRTVAARDQHGDRREVQVVGERPLTLTVDGREVVTLMTLGAHPEELALGYLRNQRLVERLADVAEVAVDWERETVAVRMRPGRAIADWQEKLARRTVTTGCGQGTVFSCTLDKLYDHRLPAAHLRQSALYALLARIAGRNQVYKQAGAVHGCALCRGEEILMFVEDVGRHNAADAIAGRMWLQDVAGGDKIFYTTGRLTSEIVMKVAHMGVPVLLSRSGVTQMGVELAADLGVLMVARAKGRAFLAYNLAERIAYDAPPPRPPPAPPSRSASSERRVAAGTGSSSAR